MHPRKPFASQKKPFCIPPQKSPLYPQKSLLHPQKTFLYPTKKTPSTVCRENSHTFGVLQLSVVVRREHFSQSLEVMVKPDWDPQAIQRSASVIAMNRRTTGQCGSREVRVVEASHPGPPKMLLRRLALSALQSGCHSAGGCYSGGYTRGPRRHSS